MKLAFDLGTSHFRAAVVGRDAILNEPCVIAHHRVEGVTVGSRAHDMIGRTPDFIDIISPVEGGVARDVNAVTEVFEYCIAKLSKRRFRWLNWFRQRVSLTMSIPTGLTQVELKALEEAARSAGVRDLRFMDASVAAAVGSGLPVHGPEGCLVVNLGAGITEAALLSMRGIVSAQSYRSGGRGVNEAIVDRVRKEHSFQIGHATAEILKRQICADEEQRHCAVRGRDLVTRLPGEIQVSRLIVDDALKAYCQMIVRLVSQVIAECPPELAGDISERGIVLHGGGGNISGISAMLEDILEVPVVVAAEPETCTIRGLLEMAKSGVMSSGNAVQLSRRQSGIGWPAAGRTGGSVGRRRLGGVRSSRGRDGYHSRVERSTRIFG